MKIFGYDIGWDDISGLWSGGGVDSQGGWGIIGDVLSNPGLGQGISSIGSGLIKQQGDEATLDYYRERDAINAQIEREKMAEALKAAQAYAGATVQAAGIAAGSADRRAKLAAIMDASSKRVDANFTGTGQKLSVISDMIGAAPRGR